MPDSRSASSHSPICAGPEVVPDLPHVGAAADGLAAVVAAQHRPRGHVDGGDVRAGRGHQQRGGGLVAAAHQDRAVGRVGAQQLLGVHGEQVPVHHRGRLPERLAERGHGDLDREAARLQHAALDLLGSLAQVHVARVQLGPGVQDGDERLAEVLLGLDAELAHPGPVAELPQPRRPRPAEPAEAAQVLRLSFTPVSQVARIRAISSSDRRRERAAGRADVRAAQAQLGQGLLDHAHVVRRGVRQAQLLEPAHRVPDLHGGPEVVRAQRVEHGQRQAGCDVRQARGEPPGADRPERRCGQLGGAGQPGEPVDPGVAGHRGELGRVPDRVLDADDVRGPVGEFGDVGAGASLVPDVQDDAEVGDGVRDGDVVVDPALGGHVRVHRLVDHDHAGAVVPGVPGRLGRGRDVVADADQQFRPGPAPGRGPPGPRSGWPAWSRPWSSA